MSRVAKTDPRLVAYADVDEANSVLGRRAGARRAGRRRSPTCCAASRTTCSTSAPTCARRSPPDPEYPPLRVTPAYTERLEAACDEYNEALPKLTSFILPGGTPAAALLHQARVVARRAERSVWALLEADAERTNAETARYLNRLSDLLFILAAGRQPRRRRPVGARRAQRRARPAGGRTPATEPSAPGGADSTQDRKPVTVEVSMASSRGPSGVVMVEDDDVRGQGQVVAAGAAAGLHPELGAAEPFLRPHRQRQRRGTRAACRRRTRRRRPTSAASRPAAATW